MSPVLLPVNCSCDCKGDLILIMTMSIFLSDTTPFSDRSTGYEAKLFQKINERSRKAKEAYQWSTEEM